MMATTSKSTLFGHHNDEPNATPDMLGRLAIYQHYENTPRNVVMINFWSTMYDTITYPYWSFDLKFYEAEYLVGQDDAYYEEYYF